MLRLNRSSKAKAGIAKFAIVASEYNSEYVNAMVKAAKAELNRAGARPVQIFRVPGAFEIPVVAARVARLSQHAAIICLGVTKCRSSMKFCCSKTKGRLASVALARNTIAGLKQRKPP